LTYTYHYSVFNGVCVSDEGDDGGRGTVAQPLATIQEGIDKADSLYDDPSEVHVSEGTYTLTSSTGRIEMEARVSVLGGYAPDWQSRNWETYTTTITDQRTENDGAVVFLSGIDSSTVFEGFTVNAATAGASSTTSAIRIQSSSPSIRNNIIMAGGDEINAARYGICIDDAASAVPSPEIANNTINNGNQGGGSLTMTSAGIYIECNSSAHIHDNVIYAGTVSSSATGAACASVYVTSNTSSSPFIIERNSLYGGSGGDPTFPSNAAFYVAYSDVPIVFRNNLVIHEAPYLNDNNRYGVYYSPDQEGSIAIRNNTIAFSSVGSGSVKSYGVFLESGASSSTIDLDNNIILYTGESNASPSNAFCIYENENIVPASVWRNDLYGLNTSGDPVVLYHDFNGDLDLTQLNTNSPHNNNASANILVNPNLAPLTFRPGATTPNEVRTGGADGNDLDWGYSDDRDLLTRTGSGGTGWTMGCYEID
jgi:hypothetical protein